MADPVTPIILPQPSPEIQTQVVHEDIRHFIWDRTIADNPLELDLEFSDEEIGWARRHAVMMFNAIPPHVNYITAEQMPYNWNYGFMLGTIYHLFVGKLMKLQRSQIDYSAGNMTVDINAKRIEYLQKWVEVFKAEAMENITKLKLVANLNMGFCAF